MTPDDLAEIHASSMEVPTQWSAADFEDLLAAPGVFLVSAEKGAGFALGRAVLDEAELLTIAVLPSHQRQGLGRKCLARFETAAHDHGAKAAHLEVAASNLAARALYAKCGWTDSGLRRGYYGTAEGRIDAILMQKRLLTA